jgi:hypothetical protein
MECDQSNKNVYQPIKRYPYSEQSKKNIYIHNEQANWLHTVWSEKITREGNLAYLYLM